MIKPTVGRVVWFRPAITDHSLASGGDQPLAAIVAHVWSDTCVNLAVFDANGNSQSRTSVLLLQDDAVGPEGGYYAEWMPYQVGQAKKHEADAPKADAPALARTDEQSTEAAIQKAGKTAPRVTPADIDAAIVSEYFFTAAEGAEHPNAQCYGSNFPRAGYADLSVARDADLSANGALRLLTFCVLVLRNGFTVTGESACASPENFDPQIGRDIARKNAREKIWLLEGYLLKQRLADAQ